MKKDNKPKVSIRGGFSDRNKLKPINKTIQYQSLDERTRIALSNEVNRQYNICFDYSHSLYGHGASEFSKKLLSEVYNQPVNFNEQAIYDERYILKLIHETIMEDDYDDVLSLLEYIARYFKKSQEYVFGFNSYKGFNCVLEKEYVGYRIVGDYITCITDEIEIDEVDKAAEEDEHIEKAIKLMSDRQRPDYENSIKESISAVEALCSHIVGEKTTLGLALKKLENNGVSIHPALKAAFEKLYGYTSDANGIRHASNIGEPSSTFEEAKYMLVVCSGFINYIKGVQSKINN